MNDVHKGIEPISYLLGTWRGEGKGRYPTIEDFSYGEEPYLRLHRDPGGADRRVQDPDFEQGCGFDDNR
jgi:hypothetical protein